MNSAPARTPSRHPLLSALLRDPWQLAAICGLSAAAVLIACFGLDAGMTLDEPLHVEYGERILRTLRDPSDQSALTYRNLSKYGGLFDVTAQLLCRISPLGVYETRHLITCVLGWLGAVLTYRIAALFGGSCAGFWASAILCLTPVWSGHALFNPKDIPFGAAAAYVVYRCCQVLLQPNGLGRASLLGVGLALGLALGVRPGGLFLFGYAAYAVLARVWLDNSEHGARRALGQLLRLAPRLLSAVALAWTLMVLLWPWAQVSPLLRPVYAALKASRFSWSGLVLFDGQLVPAPALPARYLPVWFSISLPELYPCAWCLGLSSLVFARIRLRSSARALALLLVLGAALVPVALVILRGSVLYDAQRHFLFILPPLAALSGIAIQRFLQVAAAPRPLRVLAVGLLCALSSLTAYDMLRLHPYEYVYFNRSFGGLHAASGRFETDYWGESYAEGLAWLNQHLTAGPVRVGYCHDVLQLDYYLSRWPLARERMQLAPGLGAPPDYYLALSRPGCEAPTGKVLYRVQRDGVTLLTVSECEHAQR